MQLAEFSRGISTFGAIFGSVTIGCLYIASVSQAHYMMIVAVLVIFSRRFSECV